MMIVHDHHASGASTRHQAPGIWYLVPGTWYHRLPGSRSLVPGTTCLVPGTWRLVDGPATVYQVPACPRHLGPCTWYWYHYQVPVTRYLGAPGTTLNLPSWADWVDWGGWEMQSVFTVFTAICFPNRRGQIICPIGEEE